MSVPADHVFWEDPGHGWLEVYKSALDFLGISEKITPYSYISNDGKIAYLEEDQDAGVYIEAIEARGIPFQYHRKYEENIFIRNLKSFQK